MGEKTKIIGKVMDVLLSEENYCNVAADMRASQRLLTEDMTLHTATIRLLGSSSSG